MTFVYAKHGFCHFQRISYFSFQFSEVQTQKIYTTWFPRGSDVPPSKGQSPLLPKSLIVCFYYDWPPLLQGPTLYTFSLTNGPPFSWSLSELMIKVLKLEGNWFKQAKKLVQTT